VQLAGDLHRVLAADRYHRVQSLLLEGSGDLLDRIFSNRLVARGAEDRPALVEDPGHLGHAERHVVALGEAAIAAPDPDGFVALLHRRAGDGADHRVQPRAVPACGQDSDSHPARV
jgi:hypothetical protein